MNGEEDANAEEGTNAEEDGEGEKDEKDEKDAEREKPVPGLHDWPRAGSESSERYPRYKT